MPVGLLLHLLDQLHLGTLHFAHLGFQLLNLALVLALVPQELGVLFLGRLKLLHFTLKTVQLVLKNCHREWSLKMNYINVF